jgi:hypothetical protein
MILQRYPLNALYIQVLIMQDCSPEMPAGGVLQRLSSENTLDHSAVITFNHHSHIVEY